MNEIKKTLFLHKKLPNKSEISLIIFVDQNFDEIFFYLTY